MERGFYFIFIWKIFYCKLSSTSFTSQQNSGACDFTNLDEKDVVENRHIKIIGNDIWRFSMFSGDVNPIHTSNLLAYLFGQKGRIAHGVMVMAKALSLIDNIEGVHIPNNKLGVSFKGPTVLHVDLP